MDFTKVRPTFFRGSAKVRRTFAEGFGLIVMILLMIGLSLGASALFVSVTWLRNDAAVTRTKANLREIASAVAAIDDAQFPRRYELDVGALPATLNDLLTKPAAVAACAMDVTTRRLTGWCGPYWAGTYTGENLFVDNWGRALVFEPAMRRVRSLGANGADDAGAGDDIVQGF